MNYSTLIIRPLTNFPLLKKAQLLPNVGVVKNHEGLVYLDIDDNFIHDLYPLLNEFQVQKPDYFSDGIGAHVSIIYPNEVTDPEFELNRHIHFSVLNLVSAESIEAIYYVLTIQSPELIQIRKMNSLGEKLNLNGYIIGLHSTIGKITKIRIL